MTLARKSLLLLVLMLAAAASAIALRPTMKMADLRPTIDLNAIVPPMFADWREEPQASGQVVNPQQKETLDKLYSQTLSRTYVSASGARIMLSIAYGRDQSDSMQLHYPELCYPSQGFQVLANTTGEIHLASGIIPVKRLLTSLNRARIEPVTYWVMIGDESTVRGVTKKLAEMRYGFRGEIPDGLLFRVSSIDADSNTAFKLHERFISEMFDAVRPENRPRLFGVGVGTTAVH
jgi:EpsI family protein